MLCAQQKNLHSQKVCGISERRSLPWIANLGQEQQPIKIYSGQSVVPPDYWQSSVANPYAESI